MDKPDSNQAKNAKRDKRRFVPSKKIVRYVGAGFAGLLLVAGIAYGYMYLRTPAHIRRPAFEHYHFRTQIVVDGNAVDFSKREFQEENKPAACSTAVTSTPIHFHDEMDQMTHVHWKGMTGGEFLKYYGWNFIGGTDNSLGYRYDKGLLPRSVGIYGNALPARSPSAKFYVYIGEKDNYQQKTWNDFLKQDLELFFGKKSLLGQAKAPGFGIAHWLFPKASAHGGIQDEHSSNKSEEELKRINNLLGNVVIFAQEQEPTKEQIQARFDNLVPLGESTCGG